MLVFPCIASRRCAAEWELDWCPCLPERDTTWPDRSDLLHLHTTARLERWQESQPAHTSLHYMTLGQPRALLRQAGTGSITILYYRSTGPLTLHHTTKLSQPAPAKRTTPRQATTPSKETTPRQETTRGNQPPQEEREVAD